MSKPQLKPCPFCGENPELIIGKPGYACAVRCDNDFCHAKVITQDMGTIEAAIKAWNKRAHGWQPIETVPPGGAVWLWPYMGDPTHWCPIPEPPKE